MDDDDDSDEKEEEDPELISDSNFEDNIEKMINFSDMDQSMKGEDINFIGQVEALGADRKKELRELNYQEPGDNGELP